MDGSMLRIVTRESPLAMWQARFVRARLQETHPGLSIGIKTVKTLADRFLHKTLGEMGGKGVFVKELEQALLDGEADLAVHSMKDVTVDMPAGLTIAAILEREDPRDVFISDRYPSLEEMPEGARIGTSSLRRQCQLRAAYPELLLRDIRGNVDSRLQKLDDGAYDSLILAAAGLKRLGREHRIRAYLEVTDMLPAIGQGALGVEIRANDTQVEQLVRPLDHGLTRLCVSAERALSRKLYGGCHLPLAGYARISGETLSMTALVGYPDGSRIVKDTISGAAVHAEKLGYELAEALLLQGAGEILERVLGNGEKSGLSGITVWVTRPAHQAGDLCRMIEERKGVPLLLPTLVIRPFKEEARVAENRLRLAHADIVVFISKNAVIHALDQFPRIADTVRGKTVLAIGQATARCLNAAGFGQVGQVNSGGSEALLRLPVLDETAIREKRVVIVRGLGGREELRDGLLARGAVVDYLEVYRRDKPDISRAEMTEFWHDQVPDAVIITSLAGLENLVELTPDAESERLLGTPMVVMSERIGQQAVETGFRRIAVATDNTDAGLVDALSSISGSVKK